MTLTHLSNELLSTRLHQLLGEERRVQVEFLQHLDEFDRREEWRRRGYANLWQYCERELKLRENAIFVRTTAIRLLRDYPGAVDRLRDGRLCMTTLVELKDVLTAETTEELLEQASGKSKREVEALVASLKAPVAAPEVKASIRALPPALPIKRPEAPALAFEAASVSAPAAPPTPAPPIPTVPGEPRFEIKLVVSREFVEALEHAKRALSHSVPDGNAVAVLQHCLDRLLSQEAKKHAGPSKPKAAPAEPPQERTIPAAVTRAVWKRDGGRCQWKLANGETCGSRWKVQLDHIVPRALGGQSTESGCRLLCRIHNIEAARQVFGDQVMDRYRRRPDLGRPK